MAIIYQLSRNRVERWLESLAGRSKLSVFEVRYKIDAAVQAARVHAGCVTLPNLITQKLGDSPHRRKLEACVCCRSFVNLVWLCSAGSSGELREVAGNRSALLFFGLRVVENKLLGITDKEVKPKEEAAQVWGAELFEQKAEESPPSPYASVGVYDPDGDDDNYADAAGKEIPCFGFDELLQFNRLPVARRYYARECAECRTVVRNMKRVRVAVGTLVARCEAYRAAHARGKAARTRQRK